MTFTPDPPLADRCGECGLPLWPVGTYLFCANLACSMYERDATPAPAPVLAFATPSLGDDA